MFPKTTKLIENLFYDDVVPGISYAVMDNYETKTKVMGYSQLIPKKQILKPNMQYDMASLTKVIGTTTLILKLIEEGKLELDAPVNDYIPEFKDRRVTVRHLLTHTSAIHGYIPNRDKLSAYDLLKTLHKLPVINKPGEKVVYTDTGLIFLGEIIEHFYQEDVQKVIENEVLHRLGMFDSTFNPQVDNCIPTEVIDGEALKGVVHDPKARTLGVHCGSAGMFSTLNDLLKFSVWILNDDEDNTILHRKTVNNLFKDWTPNGRLGRSLGWDLRYTPLTKRACIYHTGFTGTFILLDKKTHSGMIVLTNRIHPRRDNQEFLNRRDVIVNSFLSELDKQNVKNEQSKGEI